MFSRCSPHDATGSYVRSCLHETTAQTSATLQRALLPALSLTPLQHLVDDRHGLDKPALLQLRRNDLHAQHAAGVKFPLLLTPELAIDLVPAVQGLAGLQFAREIFLRHRTDRDDSRRQIEEVESRSVVDVVPAVGGRDGVRCCGTNEDVDLAIDVGGISLLFLSRNAPETTALAPDVERAGLELEFLALEFGDLLGGLAGFAAESGLEPGGEGFGLGFEDVEPGVCTVEGEEPVGCFDARAEEGGGIEVDDFDGREVH